MFKYITHLYKYKKFILNTNIRNNNSLKWRKNKMAGEYIAWSPIRRLMKHCGGVIVARDAVDELINWLETSAEELTETALRLTHHAGRKKISREDLLMAIKYF